MKPLPCPASLRATLRADGADLSFVTATVADKDGLLVPRSKNARSRDVGWKFGRWIDVGHGELSCGRPRGSRSGISGSPVLQVQAH